MTSFYNIISATVSGDNAFAKEKAKQQDNLVEKFHYNSDLDPIATLTFDEEGNLVLSSASEITHAVGDLAGSSFEMINYDFSKLSIDKFEVSPPVTNPTLIITVNGEEYVIESDATNNDTEKEIGTLADSSNESDSAIDSLGNQTEISN